MTQDLRNRMSQLPLFTPNSEWRTPETLPFVPSDVDLSIDTETRDDGIESGLGPGWPFGLCRCIGISMAWLDQKIYLPIRHIESTNIPPDIVRKYVQDAIDRASRVVGFNMAYDIPVLGLEGISIPIDKVEDAYVCAAMLSQNEFSYSLEECCIREGIPGKDTALLHEALVAYTGKTQSRGMMWKLPARYVGPYAEQDAASTLQLWNILRERITNNELDGPYRTEIKLIEVTTAMRRRGVPIATERAEEAQAKLRIEVKKTLSELSSLSGSDMTMSDISSAKRLARHFDRVGVRYMTTRTGLPSFEADWLGKHAHSFPQLVARVRSMNDLSEKFISNYLLGFTHNGHIHPEWSALRDSDKGTRTGRLSSSNPPFQQIPGRKEYSSRIIRGLMQDKGDGIFLSADYKSQEPRLAVHFAELMNARGATDIADAYRTNPDTDLHGFAANIIGISRSSAKIIILGMLYGMAPKGMAIRLGITEEEAKDLYDRLNEGIPFLKDLMTAVTSAAEQRGYIKLLDGARLFFDLYEPRIWADREGEMPLKKEAAEARWPTKTLQRAMCRKALNYLIQGSAARQVKIAMVACHEEGYTPLISLHDELDFIVQNDLESSRILEIMKNAVTLKVPTGIDAEFGRTWGAANHFKYKSVAEARAGELT